MLGFWRVIRQVSWVVLLVAAVGLAVALVHPTGQVGFGAGGIEAWQVLIGASAAAFVAFGAARTASTRGRRIVDRQAQRAARPTVMRRVGRRAAARRRGE